MPKAVPRRHHPLQRSCPHPSASPAQQHASSVRAQHQMPMSSDTQATLPTTPYHPKYKRFSGAVTLESSDGLRFCVDPHSLAAKSSFFRHLFEIPQPPDTHETVIPLTSTGSDALSVVLEHISGKSLTIPRPLAHASTFLEQAVHAAPYYDLPSLHQALFERLLKQPNDYPPATFVFAVLSGQPQLSRYTFPLLPYGEDTKKELWWTQVLRHQSPQTYAQLEAVFERWRIASALFSSTTLSQSPEFGQRCRSVFCEKTQRYIHYTSANTTTKLCPVFQAYNGNFDAFRRQVSPSLHALLRSHKRIKRKSPSLVLSSLGVPKLSCDDCVNRLARDLQTVVTRVKKEWTDVPHPELWPVELRWVAQTPKPGRKKFGGSNLM